MKLFEIIIATIPLRNLSEVRFTSFKKAREISILRKKVESEADFYAKEERKLIEKFAEKNEKGEVIFLDGGRIKLKDLATKEAFEKEIIALKELDIENIEKVALSESDFADVKNIPTPNELLALEAIIDFGEE